MYIHAYQSYVWNAIVSERIRSFGADKPIVGDLVFDKGEELVGDNMNIDKPEVDEQDDEKDGHSPTLSTRVYTELLYLQTLGGPKEIGSPMSRLKSRRLPRRTSTSTLYSM